MCEIFDRISGSGYDSVWNGQDCWCDGEWPQNVSIGSHGDSTDRSACTISWLELMFGFEETLSDVWEVRISSLFELPSWTGWEDKCCCVVTLFHGNNGFHDVIASLLIFSSPVSEQIPSRDVHPGVPEEQRSAFERSWYHQPAELQSCDAGIFQNQEGQVQDEKQRRG